MGAIRLFLAFVVVIDHVRLIVLHPLGIDTDDYIKLGMNAGYAVMFFYVISGFLISYVLQNKYPVTPGGTYRFYRSRAIRIYALYWGVWALSSIALDPGRGYAIWTGRLRDLLPSLFLFGADWRVSFGDYPHEYFGLFPTGLNPAWSLGVEMTFYLIAPFLLRSLTGTVFVLLMAILVRAALVHVFGFNASWTYHFFPSTVLFFLLGHLSRVLSARLRLSPKLASGFLLPSILFSLLSAEHPFDNPYFYLSVTCFAVSLPGVFALTKDTKALNFMGDISYAVYLTHPLVVTYILPFSLIFLLRIPYLSNHAFALACAIALLGVALTAAVATGAEVFVERPMRSLLGSLFGWGEVCVGAVLGGTAVRRVLGLAVPAAPAIAAPPLGSAGLVPNNRGSESRAAGRGPVASLAAAGAVRLPRGRQLVTLFGALAAIASIAMIVHHVGPPPAAINSLSTIVQEARLASLPVSSAAPHVPAGVALPLASGEAEGAAVATAAALETPAHGPAYALRETQGDGFHRINILGVATYPDKLNVISFYVRPEARTSLRIELLGSSRSHYGRADFDLLSGEVKPADEAEVATIVPIEGGWFLVSFGMRTAEASGVVSVSLLAPGDRVKYAGESGKGLVLGAPTLQAK